MAGIIWLANGPVTFSQVNEPPLVQTDLESAASLLAADQPRDALRALTAVGSREPDNPWMWFYRGLAYLKLGNWYVSMASLDRAQDLLTAYGDPEPQLSESIRRYRRQARSQVFGISYQIGLAYDSNVTFLGSGGAGFDIAGRGDGKFTSRLQFAYAPIANETESLTLRARIAQAWNFAIEEFDDQDYGASIRYTRNLNDHWQATLQYDYDITYLGNDPFLSNHALSPGIIYNWQRPQSRLRPTETTLFYRIEARDFLFDTDPAFDRDGFANAVGLEQKWALRPTAGSDWTWDLSTGYALESVATEGTEFDRLDHLFYLGLQVPLTNRWLPDKEFTVRFDANWQIADYREDSVIDGNGDQRSDLITTLGAVLSQQLVQDADLGELTLHAIVGWTDANSNVTTADRASPFTYDKWVAGLQLEWSW